MENHNERYCIHCHRSDTTIVSYEKGIAHPGILRCRNCGNTDTLMKVVVRTEMVNGYPKIVNETAVFDNIPDSTESLPLTPKNDPSGLFQCLRDMGASDDVIAIFGQMRPEHVHEIVFFIAEFGQKVLLEMGKGGKL